MNKKPSLRHGAKKLHPAEWQFCLAGKVEAHDLADCWRWEILREKRHQHHGLVGAAHDYRRNWEDWSATCNPITGLGNPFSGPIFSPVMPTSLLALMESDSAIREFHFLLLSPDWPEKAWLATNRRKGEPPKGPMEISIQPALSEWLDLPGYKGSKEQQLEISLSDYVILVKGRVPGAKALAARVKQEWMKLKGVHPPNNRDANSVDTLRARLRDLAFYRHESIGGTAEEFLKSVGHLLPRKLTEKDRDLLKNRVAKLRREFGLI